MSSSLRIIFLSFLLSLAHSSQDLADYHDFYKELLEDGLLTKIAQQADSDPYNLNKCANDLSLWRKSLREIWALKMIDAGGKLPEALLMGNTWALGQYDECLSIKEDESFNNITGKYCLVDFSTRQFVLQMNDLLSAMPMNATAIPNINIRLGICMPASCNANYTKTILDSILDGMNKTVRPIVRIRDNQCKIDEPKTYSGSAIAAITVFSIFALFLLASTIYDLYQRHCCESQEKSRCHDLFISFSIYTNTKKMVTVSKSSNTLKCLNGLRVFSMCWVVVCHRYSMVYRFPLQNMSDIPLWLETFPATIIMGGSVVVDTFFIMSGLLLAYVFLCQTEKNKSFNIGMFYLHRFLRIWPAMAAAVLFQAGLLVHLGSGPVWFQIQNRVVQPCEDNWWINLLFVQNYVRPNNMCLGHLWYIAIDTHLYILSPILLLPLLYKPRFGFLNIIFWMIATQISMITVSYTGGWAGINSLDSGYWNNYYRAIHVRAAVWMIGVMGGYILYVTRDKKIKINKILVLLLWVASLATLCAAVFGTRDMLQPDHEINDLEDATFNAFARTGWGLAIFWIIFACVKGYGGPINWFLSWNLWEIVGRVSYSMYLIHTMIQAVITVSTRTVNEFNHYQIIYTYFGDMVYALFTSYIWVLAFESPFLGIEKALFHKKKAAPVPAIAKSKEDIA